MFSEILKIKPRLDNADLNKMDRQLGQRFGKIAKKFGKGLVGALAGGGIAGLALGIIDKLLNPLKETQEAIDRVLQQGDDIVTNAGQFNTTAGKLFKLTQLGKATGLDEGSLYTLMQKFQGAVAEAGADPAKPSAVRNFVGQEDQADAFFEFIQALQKMDKSEQVLVQAEVFGEKQIQKMSDFLQSDFGKLGQMLQLNDASTYDVAVKNLGAMKDLTDALEARRTAEDIVKKGTLITQGIVNQKDAMERFTLTRENERIGQYGTQMAIAMASQRMMTMMESGIQDLAKIVINSTNITSVITKFSATRMFKGWLGMGKDK